MHSKRPISAAVALTALLCVIVSPIKGGAQSLSPDEARAIAKGAYIYGFLLVDNYRILYPYFVDNGRPGVQGPWNELQKTAQVFASENNAVQIPLSDMPYAEMGADLRAAPLAVAMPVIKRQRFNLTQVIDLYSLNLAYIGKGAER